MSLTTCLAIRSHSFLISLSFGSGDGSEEGGGRGQGIDEGVDCKVVYFDDNTNDAHSDYCFHRRVC